MSRNSFYANQEVERESMRILWPFLEAKSADGRFVLTEKGRLGRELQRAYGDVFMQTGAGAICAVECKAERENRHGNLFLESWSNRHRFTVGWLYTLNADVLLYHFLASDELYCVPFSALRKWCFHHTDGRPRLFSGQWRERMQSRHEQLNDTWGWCVPIDVLRAEVPGFKEFNARTGQEVAQADLWGAA